MGKPSGILTADTLDSADPAIWAKVRSAFAEALGLDDDEVELQHKIIEELDAESLDFLDIAFRLERAFRGARPLGRPRRGVERAQRVTDPALGSISGVELSLRMPDAIPPSSAPGGPETRSHREEGRCDRS